MERAGRALFQSVAPAGPHRRRGVPKPSRGEALGSGFGRSFYFSFISPAEEDSLLWPASFPPLFLPDDCSSWTDIYFKVSWVRVASRFVVRPRACRGPPVDRLVTLHLPWKSTSLSLTLSLKVLRRGDPAESRTRRVGRPGSKGVGGRR